MKLALVLAVLGLLWASEGHAACHHYSRWYYPTPQPRCSTGVAAHTTREADHSWFVEFVLPEPVADPARTQGLEKLKTLLGPQGVGSLANKP
jgi:hypothetical protein